MSNNISGRLRLRGINLTISVLIAATASLFLAACSSGITLFNNAAPGYSHGGGAMPASMPMPAQPFTGNQYAAAHAAAIEAAARSAYPSAYAPPHAYPNQNYQAAQYPVRPKRIAPTPVANMRRQNPVPQPPRRAYNPQAQHVSASQGGGHDVVTVRWGQTLYGIARARRVSVDDIMAANALGSTQVRVGQKLVIPVAGYARQTGPSAPQPPRRGVTVAGYQGAQGR